MPKTIASDIRARIDARKAHDEARKDVFYLMGHMNYPTFMVDPRTGKPFLLQPTTELRHYPSGAGSPA